MIANFLIFFLTWIATKIFEKKILENVYFYMAMSIQSCVLSRNFQNKYRCRMRRMLRKETVKV